MSEYKTNDNETTNKLETYAKGFQDGWNLAMKQAREEIKDFTEKNNSKLYPTLPTPSDNAWTSCPVCGRTGLYLGICTNPKCPTMVTCGATGATGTTTVYFDPKGSNGGSE